MQNSIWEKIDRVLIKVMTVICIVVLLFFIAGIFVYVVSRLLGHGIVGMGELAATLMPWVAYSGLVFAAKENAHVQMTAISDKYKGAHKVVAAFLIEALVLVYMCIMFYASGDLFLRSLAAKERAQAAVTIYMWWGKIATPISIAPLIYHTVWNMIKICKFKKTVLEIAEEEKKLMNKG